MEWAGKCFLIATFEPTQLRTTVRTGIDQRMQFVVFVTGDHNRGAPHGQRKIIAGIWDLAFMRHIDPIPFKDMF